MQIKEEAEKKSSRQDQDYQEFYRKKQNSPSNTSNVTQEFDCFKSNSL